MKTATKILICLLALCMLLPCVVSCNQKKKKPASNQNKKPTSSVVTTVDPDADIEKIAELNGYQIWNIYVPGN